MNEEQRTETIQRLEASLKTWLVNEVSQMDIPMNERWSIILTTAISTVASLIATLEVDVDGCTVMIKDMHAQYENLRDEYRSQLKEAGDEG
jgi:hypothetical protein